MSSTTYASTLLHDDQGVHFEFEGETNIPVIRMELSSHGHHTVHVGDVNTRLIDHTIKTMRETADRMEIWNELRKTTEAKEAEDARLQAEYENQNFDKAKA
jgi:hypothetical protein